MRATARPKKKTHAAFERGERVILPDGRTATLVLGPLAGQALVRFDACTTPAERYAVVAYATLVRG